VQATKLAMLGELTASIAHEVNQPLGAILSNADTAEILLRSDEPSLPELRKIVADIRRDDLRASEVIKRVRALIGKRQINMSPLDLNDILTEVEHLVAHDTKRRGIRIIRELEINLPPVFGDRIEIEQVFLNLFLNAMDVLKDVPVVDPHIILRSIRSGNEWVEISFGDNGPGFHGDILSKIFDSFFTTKKSGMGLGLALARSIAEAHRGHLTAENHPEGGAIFRLTLPIHSSPLP
jgi:signal transduction histidine kinase